MDFRVGQTVKLIDNSNMVAPIGATATIYCIDGELINVRWKTNYNCQDNGGYFRWHFKPLLRKSEQLLFSFMG